jgi:AcrR family transcriptional regulator
MFVAMPRRTTSPDALLDGVAALLRRDGIASVTIEAAARECGVSKGAVLHHFPSKSHLLMALVARTAKRIEAGIGAHLARDTDPGALVRAILALDIPAAGDGTPSESEQILQGVLAAAIHDPDLLQPMREMGGPLRAQVLADPRRGLADLILILARDGLLLWQTCGFIPREGALSQRVLTELRRRAALPGGDRA